MTTPRSTFTIAFLVLILGTLASAGAIAQTPVTHVRAGEKPHPATLKVLAYDKSAARPLTKYRIAYLAECTNNPYCATRLDGLKAAARKYGFEFKVFDANFSPATQLRLVQDAVARGYDGYLFAPTAKAPGCSMWHRYLRPTTKPVVTLDIPMCNDADYTPGVAATVTMVRQAFFDAHVENAFKTCTTPCKVAALGGFTGSDLFTIWERAIRHAAAKYPKVEVVSDQPGNYDPRVALRVTGAALVAHPDLDMVISSWDDMTRGAEQAIKAVGKRPGKDVRIYTTGATKDAVSKVKSGVYNETS
ncbi:MAG TPA: sugar ABC transporter substrate-binding protein, partial [Gaiellaceae bacterium]|nr:sugar ABC transporter substrate-binding protein [Gaiellaceae bacterium]